MNAHDRNRHHNGPLWAGPLWAYRALTVLLLLGGRPLDARVLTILPVIQAFDAAAVHAVAPALRRMRAAYLGDEEEDEWPLCHNDPDPQILSRFDRLERFCDTGEWQFRFP